MTNNKDEVLENKVRKYRVVIKNLAPPQINTYVILNYIEWGKSKNVNL